MTHRETPIISYTKAIVIGAGVGLFVSATLWYFQPTMDGWSGRSSNKKETTTPAPSYHFHFQEAPRPDKKRPKQVTAPLLQKAPVLVYAR